MAICLRIAAFDYDGTLTDEPRPSAEVLDAIAAARARGLSVVLVTGRILSELRADFADVDSHFDAIIGENGCVLSRGGAPVRHLATPIADELYAKITERRIPARRGAVLLATEARYDAVVLGLVAELGLECQLVHNRGALMVLPPGVNKGTGLVAACEELGLSPHNAIGVGDAENDHSLLEACEVGVAVANAISSLKTHADLVLTEPNGLGVKRLLETLHETAPPRFGKRRHIVLGAYDDGTPAAVPALGAHVLIAGGTGSGKSYAAGLVAEQLIHQGYSLCILDPEGDHVGLSHLRGVEVFGGENPLPTPDELAGSIERDLGTVVVDLSLYASSTREQFIADAMRSLSRLRKRRGVPHWIFIDEAHVSLGSQGSAVSAFEPGSCGLVLVTYHARELDPKVLASIDVTLLLPNSDISVDETSPLCLGEAAILERRDHPSIRRITLGRRTSEHVRHWHKYVQGRLPNERRFSFRSPSGTTGVVAANLTDFVREVRNATADVIEHHAGHRDFSRWIRDVFANGHCAEQISRVESSLADRLTAEVESARREVLDVIARHYPDGFRDQNVGEPSSVSNRPLRSRTAIRKTIA